MRIKSVIKNSIVALILNLILYVFKFLLRKVFLLNFDVYLLGYEGLFSSIFLVLSIVEMGSGSIFGYMLYKAVSENDFDEQSVIIAIYKRVYIAVGIMVLIFGMIIFAFLRFFIQDSGYDINYLRLIYLIQLFTIVVAYFLSYSRGLLFASQKSYIVVFFTTFYETIGCILRIVLILLYKNYLVYIIIPLFTTFLSNYSLLLYCKKNYPNIRDVEVTYIDYKRRDIFRQLKSLLVSKISTVLYTTSDSIIISTIVGVKTMGLYSNYLQFVGVGKTLLSYFTEPLGHSVGNLVYTEDIEKRTKLYRCIDLLGTYFGIFYMVTSVCIFKRIISLFFGYQYMLGINVVIAISLDFYVRCRGIAYNAFRSTVGHYEETRVYDALAAITNILFSIIFGMKYGIEGILFSTIIGNILIHFGRAKITFKYSVKTKVFMEILKEIYYLIVLFIILFISCTICSFYKNNTLGLLWSVITSAILSISMCILFTYRFIRTSGFLIYLYEVSCLIKNKVIKDNGKK